MSQVTLRLITTENINQAIRLAVREDQRHFVASNACSLAGLCFSYL